MTEYSLTRRSVLKNGAIATSALVLGGTAASGTAAAGIGDGRVAHYHLNNLQYNVERGSKEQNHVHDASTEKNHGTWNGDDSPVVDGAVGNAFALDGEDDYIEVADADSLNVTTVTVAAWLKFDQAADYHFFLSKRGSSNGDEYQMYCRGEDAGSSSTELAYYDGETIYDGNVTLEADTWHHLAWVVDTSGFRAYHDGARVLTRDGADRPLGEGDSPLFIGKDNVGNFASGMIDEVRIYDRALSEEEISELASMDSD